MSETVQQENRRRQLVEYFIREVTNGISGRDGEDIIDITPSRALFVGVLQPPRSTDAAAPGRDTVAPPDTALGLDFRVVPSRERVVRLTITPRFSVYYPIFPDFNDALYANRSVLDPNGGSNDLLAVARDESSSIEDKSVDDEPLDDGSPERNTDAAAQIGRDTLPRVFRRHDINVQPFTVAVEAKDNIRTVAGGAEIAEAITKARQAIEREPGLWRHLASPEEASRELGDAATIASRRSYEAALRAKGTI